MNIPKGNGLIAIAFIGISLMVINVLDPYKPEAPRDDYLYFFYQPNCGPCQGMEAYLETIQGDYPGIFFQYFDVTTLAGNVWYTRYMKWHEQDHTRKGVPVVLNTRGIVQGFDGAEKADEAVRALLPETD